jgi:hypothetical protein
VRRVGRGSSARSTTPTRGGGGPLKIVAYITDELSIRRILDHSSLSPPQQDKPPPIGEVVRVPLDDEGREIEAG